MTTAKSQPAAVDRSAFWQDRRVFVTGATGLVGAALTRNLLGLGADVVALVRDWVPGSALVRDGTIEKITVVRGDIRDQDLLSRALAEYEIVTVIHLAAQTIVPIANRNPVSTWESNIAGTWRLLEGCRLNPKVSEVVLASSDKAYGEVTDLPYREDTPLQAVFPYDASKACGDIIAKSYAKSFGVPASVTRCGNFFGGGDLNWNRLVPGTVRSVVRGEQPVIRSDGTLVRDYIYVEDAVGAYLTLAEQLAHRKDLAGEAFNFSTGERQSARELVDRILGHMGTNLMPDVRNEASNEIPHQYLDASKARDVLGWRPGYGLDEGLKATIGWYRSYLEAA